MKTATKWSLVLATTATFLQTAALCSRQQSARPQDGQTAEAKDDGEDAVDGQALPTPANTSIQRLRMRNSPPCLKYR